MAAVCVLSLATLLVLLGSTGALQQSSSRRVLEWSHAQRLLDRAADSAFEEAAARFEQSLPDVPAIAPDPGRDLASFESWPKIVTPASTRRALAGEGVTIDPVKVTSSRWLVQSAAAPNGRWYREMGIVQLETVVRVVWGSTALARRVVVRRYASTMPVPGQSKLRVRICPVNLLLEVKDA